MVGLLITTVIAGCNGLPLPIPLIGNREPAAIPEWVARPPTDPGMVYAVGQAPLGQRETALANAKRELVSQLKVTIQSDTRTGQRYSADDGTGQARTERYQETLNAEVRQRSGARDLPGVAPVRQEDAQGSTYVLVALDRTVWAADLDARIQAVDANLVQEQAAANAMPSTTPSERLALAGQLLGRILPMLTERSELVESLRQARPGIQPVAGPVSRSAIARRLESLLADLPIALPSDPALAGVLPALTDSLHQVGLVIVHDPRTAALRIELTLNVRSEVIAGQVRADGQLQGALVKADGQRLGGIALSERASALSTEVARERVIRKLANSLAEDLDARLLTMLAGR